MSPFVPVTQLALPRWRGAETSEIKKPEPLKFKVVWEKLIKVYYASTLMAFAPIMSSIVSLDVLRLQSKKTGARNLMRLSLIDLWEGGENPYPNDEEALELLQQAKFQTSDIIEMSVLAKLIKEDGVLNGKGKYFILSNDHLSLRHGIVKLYPSIVGVNQDFKVDLTYKEDVNQHHALFLAAQEV